MSVMDQQLLSLSKSSCLFLREARFPSPAKSNKAQCPALPADDMGWRATTAKHREAHACSFLPVFVPVLGLPLCLAKYRPNMMSRQSIANTTTATTPPITAWSTVLIDPSSPARESAEIRRGIGMWDLLGAHRKFGAAAVSAAGKASPCTLGGRRGGMAWI